jgi:hypothetical protein
MVTLALVLAASASPALAQTPPEGAPPAAPPASPPPEATPPPPPPAAPPSAVATEAKPPTSTEAMPATRPDVLPPIDVGAWLRVGSTFQGSDPKKLNDWKMSSAYAELHAGGKIHKKVGVTLNLNADYGGVNVVSGSPTTAIEDAIIQFDLDDAFHVWVGHLLVPVDRANASGPFFMIPWNYPGIISVGADTRFYLPAGEGAFGRNNGVVVWGDVVANKLTYLAGVFDNGNVASSPFYSGRVRLALWDTEPGFWGNASFFGDKDMLSVGVGGEFQKHGSTTATGGDKDYAEVNADVLLEKKLPGGGWVTAEGAYYHYNVNDGGLSDSAYILAAFATGPLGVGNVQPMARYQYFKLKGDNQPKPMNFDAGISYLIKGPALRLLATYSYTKLDTDVTANAIQLSAQAIFF